MPIDPYTNKGSNNNSGIDIVRISAVNFNGTSSIGHIECL